MWNELTKDEIKKVVAIIRASANIQDRDASGKASAEFTKALETPIRQVLLSGDTLLNVFERLDYSDENRIEIPIDLIAPGDEDNFYAYVHPGEGSIPERRVEGDYIMIPTYEIANAIDVPLRIVRNANWDIVRRMMEILESGFVKKRNDDGWQTVLAAGVDRNIVVNDANAAAGQLTPRLIVLMQTFMRRNGGGNAGSPFRSKLTHLYVSPEAHMDIRTWGLDLIPDDARTRIFYAQDGSQDLINVFGVNLVAMDELGESQEYQNYFGTNLAGSMASGDNEIVIGLDRQRNDSFVNPVRRDVEVFEDNTTHRRGIFSLYGNGEHGFAVLDSRRTLLGSL